MVKVDGPTGKVLLYPFIETMMDRYVGIDLAGSLKNPTGLCLISTQIEVSTVYKGECLLDTLGRGDTIAIDAPLTDTETPFRKAERAMMDDFGPMLPLNMDGMRKLSNRAQKLIEDIDGCVIETYPRAVEKTLNIERDEISISFENEHEYDAFLCSLSAKAYSEGDHISYGEDEEIIILDPELGCLSWR